MCCGFCPADLMVKFETMLGFLQILWSVPTPESWVLLLLIVKSLLQALVFSSRPHVRQQNCVRARSYFHLCAGCPLGV